jgi:hypothetical protein
VSYGKVVAKCHNGVMALLTSINEIQRMEGKAVWAKKDIVNAAEESHQTLGEEQLVRVLSRLGAYRLAVIEPMHEFRPKLGVGSGEEGALVYMCFDGKGHWDGVQLTSPYSRYSIPESAVGNIAAVHPNDRGSLHTRLSLKLKGYIALEAYSDYQRNPLYLKIPITRIRTWAGTAAREGGIGEDLRSGSQLMRAGRRGKVFEAERR